MTCLASKKISHANHSFSPFSRLNQNGFTLVELAIVLMIIGLLIGGILRGQEMLQNARVTSTIEQVKAYTAGFHTFVDAYNNYPGDMSTATTRLAGCVSPCANGNGDSIIGPLMNADNVMDTSTASENTQFWNHLALAHIISGISPNSTTTAWGQSAPAAKIGGGFLARTATSVGWAAQNVFNQSSNVFLLRGNANGNVGPTVCSTASFCATSPQRAAQIDKKMDDGVGGTGDVRGISISYSSGCGYSNQGINGASGYSETMTEKVCDMFFVF